LYTQLRGAELRLLGGAARGFKAVAAGQTKIIRQVALQCNIFSPDAGGVSPKMSTFRSMTWA
jgi:hypothetical protein